MNFSEPFIRRPVATLLLMAAILLSGFAAWRALPVSDLPNVEFPVILVRASLPGASPETMASAVATPLEKQFSTIAGVEGMTSTSQLGSTSITLQFALERDIDAAAQDVQSAIAAVQRRLPPEMTAPPSYSKQNPANDPILYLALTSPTLPLAALNEYAENSLAQRISTIDGVAQVQIIGSAKYAVRIQLDPDALAACAIGLDEVGAAIRTANVNLPTGTLWGADRAWTVKADGQLADAAAHRKIIVAHRGGRAVRLEEVARVIDGVENDKNAAWFVHPGLGLQQRAIVLAVQRQPGSNTVAVSDRVMALLPTFRAQLPGAASLHLLFDRADSIRESLHDVNLTLLLTFGLVICVIYAFLGSLRATIIPSLALPFSIIGTFGAMHLLGFGLNNLSLMALTLAVGFVVDDAIVVLENIVRHAERGESRLEAALRGSREVGFTVLSMTLSLVAVFLPVFFLGGIVGRLFREFAATIGAAILISGAVSLTLTPMLCGRMLRIGGHAAPEGGGRAGLFDRLRTLYAASLAVCLRRFRTVLCLSLVMAVATVLLFRVVPRGFVPGEDRSQLFVSAESAEGTPFPRMAALMTEAAEAVKKDPNVEAFMVRAGGRGDMAATNSGGMFLRLKPRGERPLSVDEVILRSLRPAFAAIPGLRAFPRNPETIPMGARLSKAQYQITVTGGSGLADLQRSGAELEAGMRRLPGIVDVSSDLQIRNPELAVKIDRDKAAGLGLTVDQIERALYDAYGARQVATIYGAADTYPVLLELLPERQADPASLGLLHVRSSRGTLAPLSTIARLGPAVGPLSVNHTGQLPSVTVSFNLRAGVPLGEGMAQVEAEAGRTLPAGTGHAFQGTAQAFQASFRGLGWLLLAAVLVTYIVLGMLYESFLHPLTILSGLVPAGLGALLTLWATKTELNLYSFVGIILLVGLVKKNGIMMVDFAIVARRERGLPPPEAILEACTVRFRPILMTTLAALAAAIPIAAGWGAGGEARRPLGMAVVGGLAVSQFLTLYITPAVYLALERLSPSAAADAGGSEPS